MSPVILSRISGTQLPVDSITRKDILVLSPRKKCLHVLVHRTKRISRWSDKNQTSYRPTNEDCLMRIVTTPSFCKVRRDRTPVLLYFSRGSLPGLH